MEDIEKGVETTELWVERLRIAAVEHYSKHHVPQGYRVTRFELTLSGPGGGLIVPAHFLIASR